VVLRPRRRQEPERALKKLGKYEVLGELGHGAMGVVYRARDPIINRLVALKTITTGLASDPALLQRFYREAQSAGGLQHPNIVTIYDMGEAEDLPYIAMELVEGENLEQLIARKTVLPLTMKLVYAMQACRALDYAHKRGIVHRDIKPGNVMLGRDGTVKVVDFGIARVLETSKTQTGMLIGTFAYMSPEQYHGEHADERSDIWSFGVLLYELLCYQRPFIGPTPASLMNGICNDEPTPLSKYLPECPDELQVVMTKILQKSPAERYQSMEDVLLELDPVLRTLQSQFVVDLIAQSRLLVEQSEFAQARDLLRQALQVDSGNQQARGLLERANAGVKRQLNRPKAQQCVEKAQTLLEEGKVQQARVEVEHALEFDSTFTAARELQRAVLEELERARLLAEWLESAKQRVAEGMPDEAEVLLAKVLQADPSHAQAAALQQQVTKEKTERERRRRLSENLRHARELWTQQKYSECVTLLVGLEREFPDEEEIPRLLETVREDQAEHQKQQGLLNCRNMLSAGRHEECLALLTELQKQFPRDEEIPRLLEDVRRDQMNQRRLQALAEARSLLAAGQYDATISMLISLREEFPDELEIPSLLESARQNQVEQRRQRSLAEARNLLSARQYKECNALLTKLQKEFPGDEEILSLERAVRDEQAEQSKRKSLEEARKLLTALRCEESLALLANLEKQFPGDGEISQLQAAVREDQAKQRRLQGLGEARNLLASKDYEKSLLLLASLQKEFPEEDEVRKLLESARKEQAEHRKREGIAQARSLLAARRYDESVALLSKLQLEFPPETAIGKLLESTRKEQLDQRKREGLAQARSLLAARRYDDSITLLSKLQGELPGEGEIGKLLATARADLAEQQKQLKLAEARNLVAAQSFVEALAVLDGLAAAHPKDSAVLKLRTMVHREQEKHVRTERIEKELDGLKKLIGEKKYPEVLSQAKELLSEFPTEVNIIRLAEFAKSQQAAIDRESQFQKFLQETKALFDAGRFEDAIRVVQSGLKAFPANQDLLSLYQQSEIQSRKLQVRQQIERRIREIKVKINREKFSEAVDMAQETLVTLGPDTDLSQLLSSARVEIEARDKKRLQERTLDTIRTLVDSGDLDAASKKIEEVVDSKVLEPFDPRIQRLSEQIKEVTSAPTLIGETTAVPPAPPTLSKEYAFLQAAPLPTVPPPVEKTAPVDASAVQPSTVQPATVQPVAPATVQPAATQPMNWTQPVAPTAPPVPPPQPVVPATPIQPPPPAVVPSTSEVPAVIRRPEPPSAPSRPKGPKPSRVPKQIRGPERIRETREFPEAVVSATPKPFLKRTPVLVGAGGALALALFAILHFVGSRQPNVAVTRMNAPENSGAATGAAPSASPAVTARPDVNPAETQQRDAITLSDKLIASGDLNGAMKALQGAEKLNGPLTTEIKTKEDAVNKSKSNDTAAKLWQRATEEMGNADFDAAKRDLRKIVASDDGARKADAQRDLNEVIPRRQKEEDLFLQAQQGARGNNQKGLQRAAGLLDQVIVLDGPRKTDATSLQREVSAQIAALKQDSGKVQAPPAKTQQLPSQPQQQAAPSPEAQDWDQARNSSEPSQIEQYLAKYPNGAHTAEGQSRLQELIWNRTKPDDIGALETYVGRFPSSPHAQEAVRRIDDIHWNRINKQNSGAITEFLGRYPGSAHRSEAQSILNQLASTNEKVAAVNQPPAKPPVKSDAAPVGTANADADVRATIQRYAQAFNQRDPEALKQIWPTMGSRYKKYKNSFESASSIQEQVIIDSVDVATDGTKAVVKGRKSETYMLKGNKTPNIVNSALVFQLARSNGAWLITDVQ
jgi:eukaryotic-like serine/threonine-protein kinase